MRFSDLACPRGDLHVHGLPKDAYEPVRFLQCCARLREPTSSPGGRARPVSLCIASRTTWMRRGVSLWIDRTCLQL